MISLRETCQEYFRRRLREGWKCIKVEGHNATLLSPEGTIRQLDLRNDVETLRPNAAGDSTGLAKYPVSGGANWDRVDEAVADDGSTYVETNLTTYAYDLYNLPASGGSGTINSITVYFRCLSHYYQSYARPAIKSDSTVTYGTEVEPPIESWQTYSQTWNTNPADSQPWEWTDIDALQIGVSLKRHSFYSTARSRCTQVYVEVDYTAVTFIPQVIII